MNKMMNPEMEVVRFGAEDVIATSGPALHAKYVANYNNTGKAAIITQSGQFQDGLYTFNNYNGLYEPDANGNGLTIMGGTETVYQYGGGAVGTDMGWWSSSTSKLDESIANLFTNATADTDWYREWNGGIWSICHDGNHHSN